MKPKSHLRFYTNLFLTSALAIGGSFSLAKIALAAGTPAGTTITNTATGSFEGNTSNTPGTVTSNAVTLSVLEVTGITVDTAGVTKATPAQVGTDGLTPGPYQSTATETVRGDIVYFDFRITNTGNSPTAFFIPDVITTPVNGTLRGIRVVEVDPDGLVVTNAPTVLNVLVPTGGGITTAFLGTTDGYIPVNGTVKVRVAVEITGTQVGDTTTVVLGNTAVANGQNEDYIASTGLANRDVFTSDLIDGTVVPTTGYAAGVPTNTGYAGIGRGIDQTLETNGAPVNGDTNPPLTTDLRRKEASNTQPATITQGIDYGDAPNSFFTVLNSLTSYSNSGASHLISKLLATGLFMGAGLPDAEADGVAAVAFADAISDDSTVAPSIDDENGVTLPPLLSSSTTYTATVNVTNNTGSPAYLVGWIDFNKNNVFDAGEAQVFDQTNNTSTAVPPNAAGPITTITPIPTGTTSLSKTLTWTGISGLANNDVLYARFRLTTDLSVIGNTTVATIVAQPNRPLGVGEVEDYRITVGAATPNLNVVKRITRIAGVDIPTFSAFTPPTATSDDTDAKWPTPNTTYLRGGIACTALGSGATCNGVQGAKPTEVVEYTIYFLANGNDNLRNVKICDAIPTNTTYVPNSMILGWDGVGTVLPNPSFAIEAGETTLTDVTGDDIGRFLAIGTSDVTAPALPVGNACATNAANTNGAIFVNFGATPVIPFATANGAANAASPNRAYGFIRFRVTVN